MTSAVSGHSAESHSQTTLRSTLFALTTFLGAALLFQLEPLIGKSLLPWYGGAPAVWNTCVLYFQGVLLLGYFSAYLLCRFFSLQGQIVAQGLILLVALLTLPLQFRVTGLTQETASPELAVLIDLVVSTGPLLFALSATTPLLQAWYGTFQHSPYWLSVASNAGSLISLLLYPTLIEFWLPLSTQSLVLSRVAIVLAASVILCGLLAARHRISRAADLPSGSVSEVQVTGSNRTWWFVWSLLPSSLMLGVTTQLATEISPMPAIWIAPLAVYLLSFIIVFANPPRALIVGSGIAYVVLALAISLGRSGFAVWDIVLHCGLLLSGSIALHGQLAATRPEGPPGTSSKAALTEFYFWMSLGGLCGSALNTLVAPVIFNWMAEYPLAIVGVLALLPGGTSVRARVLQRTVLGGLALVVLISHAQPVYFPSSARTVLWRDRTFFGAFHIDQGRDARVRRLVHGGTDHGMQFISATARERRPPLSYYFFTGPIGQVFQANRATGLTKSVGIVGLGVGSIAAYAEAGESQTYYEIDPAIATVADDTRYFTYLADARRRGAAVSVELGDARLRLREAAPATFRLLILDAFTSDSIPIHLLTREALQEYLVSLAEPGILAIHISNLYIDLEPLLANVAEELGLVAWIRADLDLVDDERRRGKRPSIWLIMARSDEVLKPVTRLPGWRRAAPRTTLGVWTDDRSSLLSSLKLWAVPPSDPGNP